MYYKKINDNNKNIYRKFREEYSVISYQIINRNDKEMINKNRKLINNISLLFEDYSNSWKNNQISKEEHEDILDKILEN